MENGTKVCRKCRTEQPLNLEHFPARKEAKDGFGYVCRDCMRANGRDLARRVRERYNSDQEFRAARRNYFKEWREKNPEYSKERMRVQSLSRKGLTPQDYDAMLAQQNNGCRICGGVPSRTKYLHIDHCHTTGVVRGLLCDSCNLGLGKFKDDAELLARAIEYLKNDTGFRIRESRRQYRKSEDYRAGDAGADPGEPAA